MIRHPPRPTPFPYTTLFRSIAEPHHAAVERVLDRLVVVQALPPALPELIALFVRLGFVDDPGHWTPARLAMGGHDPDLDRKSHTSELQSPCNLVCRLLLEKK